MVVYWSSRVGNCTTEVFPARPERVVLSWTKTCWGLHQSAWIQLYLTFLRLLDWMHYSEQKDVPGNWIILHSEIQNYTSCDTWCSTSVCPILSKASSRETMPPLFWVFKTQQKFFILKFCTPLLCIYLRCLICHKRKAETFAPGVANLRTKENNLQVSSLHQLRGRLLWALLRFSWTLHG